MGAANEGAEKGGCICLDLRPGLLGGGPVGHVVLFVDVGDERTH